MVPFNPESPLANGIANGPVAPTQESPFIGYIIAMHRKMVRTPSWKAAVLYSLICAKQILSVILRYYCQFIYDSKSFLHRLSCPFRCVRSCTSCHLRRTGPVCSACRSSSPALSTPVRRICTTPCGSRCPDWPAHFPHRKPATTPRTGRPTVRSFRPTHSCVCLFVEQILPPLPLYVLS